MAKATDAQGIIYQNLKDAGCSDELTDKCMSFAQNGDKASILPLLKKHKSALLGSVRKGQKQIDCLDFLIYSLEKESHSTN